MNQKQNGIYLCGTWDTKQPSRPSVTTQLKVFFKNNHDIQDITGLDLLNEETVFLCAATGKGSTAIDDEKFKECESKEIIFGCKMGDSWEIYQVEKGILENILKKQTSTQEANPRQNIARSNCALNKGTNSKVFLNKIYPQEGNP